MPHSSILTGTKCINFLLWQGLCRLWQRLSSREQQRQDHLSQQLLVPCGWCLQTLPALLQHLLLQNPPPLPLLRALPQSTKQVGQHSPSLPTTSVHPKSHLQVMVLLCLQLLTRGLRSLYKFACRRPCSSSVHSPFNSCPPSMQLVHLASRTSSNSNSSIVNLPSWHSQQLMHHNSNSRHSHISRCREWHSNSSM